MSCGCLGRSGLGHSLLRVMGFSLVESSAQTSSELAEKVFPLRCARLDAVGEEVTHGSAPLQTAPGLRDPPCSQTYTLSWA